MAELITMTQKELSRYEVIKRLIRKEINGTEAAKQLNLTIRQVKNIKARVIKEGPRGLIQQWDCGNQDIEKRTKNIGAGERKRIIMERCSSSMAAISIGLKGKN